MGRTFGGIGRLHHFRHQSELFEGGSAGVHRAGGLYGGADAVRVCRFLAAGAVHQKGEGAMVGPQGADGRRGDYGGHAVGFRTGFLLYFALLRVVDFRHQSAHRDADGSGFSEGANFVAQVGGGTYWNLRRNVHRIVFMEN